MWRDLPFDLLSTIFSFLPPDALACAASACRNWHNCAKTRTLLLSNSNPSSSSNWFIALPLHNHNNNPSCYAQNPANKNWHFISLDFLPLPIKPLTSVGSLILFKTTTNPTNLLNLLVCNPFTREFKKLPILNTPRSNPAIGVIIPHDQQDASYPSFQVYVAGGMSSGGSTYEPTLELYDSRHDTWRVIGSLPMEFAVRLTVWTPNDGVWCDGVMYWITAARAYSLMGWDISSNSWREPRVPMAEKLEFAAVVRRKGRLALIGGGGGARAWVWELGEGDEWVLVEEVPLEVGVKFVGGEMGSWGRTKCVGFDRGIYLYRDVFGLGNGMIAWKEIGGERGEWEWCWVEGCSSSSSVGGKKVPQNLQVKGVVIPPNLARSCFFSE